MPDSAFADRLFDELTRVAGRPRRSSVGLLLVAAALVLVGVLSVGVAVGSGLLKVPWLAVEVPPASSGLPITSPVETPPVVPMPVVTVPAGILPPGSQATVQVDGLRLRHEPSTTAAVISMLAKGDTVTIARGLSAEFPQPLIVQGVYWYEIRLDADPTTSGWVAAAEGGTTFLTLSSPTTCEDLQAATVTLAKLIQAGSWHRLACLGDTPVTITGVIDYHSQGGLKRGTFEPAWLIDLYPAQTLTPEETVTQDLHDTLDMVVPPGGPAVQGRGTIVRVTGHFDDLASTTCVIEPVPKIGTFWEGAATLVCREQFVVTAVQKTGFMQLPPE
jgi:hypothetical protein